MDISKEKMQLAMANACMNTIQLAQASGVSRMSIQFYLNGKRKPKPITVGKIAKALNVKAEDLVD